MLNNKHILGVSLLDKIKLLLLFHRTTRFFLARRFLPLIVRLPSLIIRRLKENELVRENKFDALLAPTFILLMFSLEMTEWSTIGLG